MSFCVDQLSRTGFMSAIIQNIDTQQIHDEIKSHPAWRGALSGLKADQMLRAKTPWAYILRKGHFEDEHEVEYYVTFAHFDGSVRHVPFVITTAIEGWYYTNTGGGGPFNYGVQSIDDVVHLIMHSLKEDTKPLSVLTEQV